MNQIIKCLLKHHFIQFWFFYHKDCESKKSKYKIINFNRGAVERLLLSHQFGVLHSDNIQLAKLEYAPEELRSDAALG